MQLACTACAAYGPVMGTIQIRDVPDDVHRDLRLRAAERDMSLSEYLRGQLLELARLPSLADVLADREDRLELAPRDAAAAVRAGRRERAEHLEGGGSGARD